MKLQFGMYKNNLCWLCAWEGEIDRNPVAVYYSFVCVNSKQTYHRLLKSYPPFICLLSMPLSPFFAHAPIASRLYIYDELKWKTVTLRSFAIPHHTTYTRIVWKPNRQNHRANQPPHQRADCCWVALWKATKIVCTS